jgi:hypothetical protein
MFSDYEIKVRDYLMNSLKEAFESHGYVMRSKSRSIMRKNRLKKLYEKLY